MVVLTTLVVTAATPSPAQPPSVILSPTHTFQVIQETKTKNDNTIISVWLEGMDKRRQRLPGQVINDPGHVHSSDVNDILYDINISPNGRWIFRTQKQFHTECLGFLDHCKNKARPLEFRPVFPMRFDVAAWRFYAYQSRRRNPRATATIRFLEHDQRDASLVPRIESGYHIIDFDKWSADSRRVYFTLRPVNWNKRIHTSSEYWSGYYDVVKMEFAAAPD